MSRNFGIGSRDMGRAAEMVMRDRGLGYSSQATHLDRFNKFVAYCRDNGINRMEGIDRDAVVAYGHGLSERGYSAAYAQNCISSINTVMGLATEGRWESVSPTKDAGIEMRVNVREEVPASLDRATRYKAEEAASVISERCGAMAEAARGFGLRSEEAAKINAREALSQARERGYFTLEFGTKGGQSREIEVRTNAQMSVLERMEKVQCDGRSLIPPNLSYTQFREGQIREAREAMQVTTGTSRGWHDLRAAYACERYQELTGQKAPVEVGERLAEKAADFAAREKIAEELGHHRSDILVSYIGSSL